MITRLLIDNRGEIAVRIARACRELGIESVAVYSDADVNAAHVAAADRAVRLGPAESSASYLDVNALIAAARATAADAVHPGYGFLSENAAFADACERAGLIFVGPPAEVIGRMGSKIEARRIAEAAGVPVVPGVTPTDQSDAGLSNALQQIGLPALIKASAGGGGRGMRRVDTFADALDAIQSARREAHTAFSDGTLYVERLIEHPHHVEVQIMADRSGNTVHVFERECSVQRRHQKVIEESPSPNLTPALRRRMTDAAVRVAKAAGYRNAGTIEFLLDLSAGRSDEAPFYFLEMNTRLQVEHPVTEQVTGVDLVHAQIHVAAGGELPWRQDDLTQRGHAIEARVYAEDPAHGFLPQAGPLLLYREPRIPGVRIDSGFREGDRVPVYYDALLAKVIATGDTREVAATRLSQALAEFPILGIHTNVPFLVSVLNSDAFRAGSIETGFLVHEGRVLTQPESAEPPAFLRGVLEQVDRIAPPESAGADHVAWDPWSRLSRQDLR